MFQDSPPTNSYQLDKLFLPEWVTEVYYGGHWYPVEESSYREISTEDGETVVYRDSFSKELVIVTVQIQGWKIKAPPEPEEPKATVTELHPKK